MKCSKFPNGKTRTVFMTVGDSLTTGYTFRWVENLGHSVFYMCPLASIENGGKILYNLDWFTKLSPLIFGCQCWCMLKLSDFQISMKV